MNSAINITEKGQNRKPKSHEEFSLEMIDYMHKKRKLGGLTDEEVLFVKTLIEPEKFEEEREKFEKKYKGPWVYEILSNHHNGLDVDKFDYLIRDGTMLKMADPSQAIARVMDLMEVHNGRIFYPLKAQTDIYEILHTRYMMHKKVYSHKTTKNFELMVLDAMLLSSKILKIEDRIKSMSKYTNLTDNILNEIRTSNSRHEDMLTAKNILKAIESRKKYTFVDEVLIRHDAWKAARKDKEGNIKPLTEKDIIDLKAKNCDLKESDIILARSKLHYGKKEENPMKFVRVFKIDKTCKPPKKLFCPEGGHRDMLMANVPHLEHIVRIYVRKRDCAKAARETFRRWFFEKIRKEKSNKGLWMEKDDMDNYYKTNSEGRDSRPLNKTASGINNDSKHPSKRQMITRSQSQ
mmetsp:Transcript_22314/g.33248  ORF Transcript_22314/g.33248 Transcript_22314/m.33248 type:complete len:406 (+) Transcript_22314:552-1769(+)